LSILTSADRFRYELEKLVEADIDRLKDTLSLGFLDDYAQYKADRRKDRWTSRSN